MYRVSIQVYFTGMRICRNLLLTLFFILFAVVSQMSIKGEKSNSYSLQEKQEIAKEMQEISNLLNLKCKDCHLEAEKGLETADFTMLTRLGKYTRNTMLPLSEAYQIKCDYCHTSLSTFTDSGKRALQDHETMALYNQSGNKKQSCSTCHILPEKSPTLLPGLIKKNTARPFLLQK